MGDTSRESVSRERLLAIMNEELAKHDLCEDCRFQGPIYQLQEIDETECNWPRDITLRCSGRSTEPCEEVASRIVADARRRYNLAK